MDDVVLLTLAIAAADATGREVAIDLCWAAGCLGIQERGDEVIAGFPDTAAATAAAESLPDRVVASTAVVSDPLAGWEAPSTEVVVDRLLIRTGHPGRDGAPDAGSPSTLAIWPGRAFGSGSHPSTRLALQLIQRTHLRGRRVLDAGSGTGVLAVAAARLGAGSVLAADVDPVAVEVTRNNAIANGVQPLVVVEQASIDRIEETFDVVMMNVTVDVHEANAPAVRRLVGPGGDLIATGLLDAGQRDRFEALHPELVVLDRLREGPWAGLRLQRLHGERRDHGRS